MLYFAGISRKCVSAEIQARSREGIRRCPAQSRAAAEYQTKQLHVSDVDRRNRGYDMPVLFDEDRAWQFKSLLNFKQILERQFIAQLPAPDFRRGVGAKISPLPALPD